ncbi:uncharacterized protein LOC115825530 [Chanos chanos]|uniref:Uncharacterized protein LOC115825530 n=1 Tax=Chanos chanos TaxID=29144 RepID=A0A6J2WI32_CHACN|nr:uncharacterized protein LOC115825530 [Chanos chanos]
MCTDLHPSSSPRSSPLDPKPPGGFLCGFTRRLSALFFFIPMKPIWLGTLQNVHSLNAFFVASHGLDLPTYFEVITVDDMPVFYYYSNMKDASYNIYQAHGRCDLHSDGTTQAFLIHKFNGKDFISLDIESRTFTATVPQAVLYKRLRDRNQADLEIVVSFYKMRCIDGIKEFLQQDSRLRVRKVPEVRLFEKKSSVFTEITRHVTGFYPGTVQVQWFGSDMQPVVEGVIEGEVLPNGDGSYQTRKSVVIPAEHTGIHSYSCVVHQSSISGNFTQTWGSSTNIYQAQARCDLYPNGTVQAFLTHAFNGKDFVSLDMKMKTFTATVPQAVLYKMKREEDQADLEIVANFHRTWCIDGLKIFLQHNPRLQKKKVSEVRIFEKKNSAFTELMCHVTGFFPRTVQVQWFGSDMQPVVEGVIEGEVLPNGDGTYQIKKSVVIPAEHTGYHYSCVVQHSSMPGNITEVWGKAQLNRENLLGVDSHPKCRGTDMCKSPSVDALSDTVIPIVVLACMVPWVNAPFSENLM